MAFEFAILLMAGFPLRYTAKTEKIENSENVYNSSDKVLSI